MSGADVAVDTTMSMRDERSAGRVGRWLAVRVARVWRR
jgi:hypothetical protein